MVFVMFSVSFTRRDMEIDYTAAMLTILFNLFHAWNIWANWNFVTSPPHILQLLCGASKVEATVENLQLGN